MNAAVVGSSGYIAKYILDRLYTEKNIKHVIKIGRSNNADIFMNLNEAHDFDYDILENVDYVIFTAAVSSPDECAYNFDKCWSINVAGTKFFINQALQRQCKVIFFSSDAVFGNCPTVIYDERSTTNAITPYGRMKKAIEDEFCSFSGFKSIRLPYVVSAHDRFVTYCLNCMETDKTAEIYHPFYRNCVVVSDVVNVILWLLYNWTKFKERFLNVAGDEMVSRVRIADELNRFFKDSLKYKIALPGDEFFTNRSSITQMSSLYLHNYGILPHETFSEKIKREF